MTCVGDGYVALPLVTLIVSVNSAVPEQVALSGPYTLTVIVPVGAFPPLSVTESEIEPPTSTFADACVATAGDAFPTTTDSFAALHTPATGLLLSSPR